MTPGQIISTERKVRGLSQKTLSAQINVSQPTLALIELDKRQIDPDVRQRLCQVLEIDPGRLYVAEAKKFGAASLTLAEIARLMSQQAA